MATTDLSDWLTVDETAGRIGCSKRTVERLGRAKQLEQRLWRQEGTPPVAVYNPDDVARIAQERHPEVAPFVLPAVPTSHDQSGNGNGSTAGMRAFRKPEVSHSDDPIRQLAAAFQSFLLSPPSPPVAEKVAETSANPFLTLAEAAAFRHVSERLVLKWMRTEKLDFEREPRSQWTADDRGWRIRRKDLEAL